MPCGGRQFTSLTMQRNCHEFIAYENLIAGRKSSVGGERRPVLATADIGRALPLVKRALKVLVDREVSPQLGLLKSTLLQLDSTFSERDYGASTFRDFVEKVAQTGLVTLRHASEVVSAAELEGPTGRELDPRERKMAVQLIEALSGEFEPESYVDEYRKRVAELIEAKASGKRIRLEPKRESKRPASLVSALEKSLERARKERSVA